MKGEEFSREAADRQRVLAQNQEAMRLARLRAKPYDATPGHIEKGTKVATETKGLIEQLLQAQTELLVAQTAAEHREVKMLFWTRVAGIGAIAALAVSVAAIVVTLIVA